MPKHIPLILTAHTTYIGMSGKFYDQPYFVSQWSNLEIRLKLWLESKIFRQAAKVVTLTEQGKQELLTYGLKNPIYVIPNGVDLKLFNQDSDVIKDYDVLFCGRIEHRKGSRAMVAVCQALINNNNRIRILIVGYGDDDSWVNEQLGAFSNNVHLTGKVNFSEMQHYYQKSKVYVSTSYYEGLPGTCIEAMAMGLPAVVWDFSFYKGLVEQAKNGFLVEPNNLAAMADKIQALLETLKAVNPLSRNIRQHVENHYNWQKVSARILEVIIE
jgi:glycosyltransferase involved in cell wall biosynthesis